MSVGYFLSYFNFVDWHGRCFSHG